MEIKSLLNTSKYPTYTKSGYYVVSGCWHFPFHNQNFFDAYCKLLRYLDNTGKLQGNFLIGDILDMHSISRHGKGKITVPGLTLSQEYKEAKKSISKIERVISPEVKREFLYGNHEDWINQANSDPNFLKLGTKVLVRPEQFLKLKELNYNVQTSYKDSEIILGDFILIHGQWCNKHSSAVHLDRLRKSVMFVHTHRINSFHSGALASYNIGWGGDSKYKVFNYMSKEQKKDWANGFAVVYLDEDAKSHVTQIKWINDQFYFQGKKFN